MDIEEINLLKKFNPGDEYTERIKSAIEKLLAERKVDKVKIDKLERINRNLKYLYDDCCKCLVESIEKQKVKDKIEELKEDKENKYYDKFLESRDIENSIEILEELLEED